MTTFFAVRPLAFAALSASVLFLAAPCPSRAASGVGVTGQGSYVTQPDPKRPGKYLWKLWAREFIIEAPDKAVSGTLKGVSAVLFQNGKESARMVAPQAQGNNVQSIIVATGGVIVRSVAQPGTILRADTVTWYAQSNKIVAVGHVFYKNGKTGMTISPNGRLVANTALKTIRSDDGGNIKLP